MFGSGLEVIDLRPYRRIVVFIPAPEGGVRPDLARRLRAAHPARRRE
jgi:hypothetical protein